jgi:hypothetical protein
MYFKRLIFSILFCALNTYANVQPFPLSPQLDADFFFADEPNAQLNSMIPLLGNEQHNFYTHLQLERSADTAWFAGLGLGYRWIENQSAVLGGYVLVDRIAPDPHASLLELNPGVEYFTTHWDGHLNAYFPLTHNQIIRTDYGDRLGLPSSVFVDHEQLDNVYQQSYEYGNGLDGEIGYSPLQSTKFTVGGYHFFLQHAVSGVTTGIEYTLNPHVKAGLTYRYDNVDHSAGIASIKFLIGHDAADSSLQSHLLDPIERHLALLNHVSPLPHGQRFDDVTAQLINTPGFTQDDTARALGKVIERNGIYFFDQSSTETAPITPESCTAQHPCGPAQFTQNNLDAIAQSPAHLWFNGGTYQAFTQDKPLRIGENQSLEGRTLDYQLPATGSARTHLNGGLTLTPFDQLDGLILASSVIPTGITIGDSDKSGMIRISNTQIGTPEHPYQTGLIAASNQISLTGSEINSIWHGVELRGSANLSIEQSKLKILGNSYGEQGIVLENNANVSLVNSTLIVDNSIHNPHASFSPKEINGSYDAINGISASDQSNVQIYNSHIQVLGGLGGAAIRLTDDASLVMNQSDIAIALNKAYEDGIDLYNHAHATIDHSVIYVGLKDSTTHYDGPSAGIALSNAASLTLKNSTVISHSMWDHAIGIKMQDRAAADITHSTIAAETIKGWFARGIEISGLPLLDADLNVDDSIIRASNLNGNADGIVSGYTPLAHRTTISINHSLIDVSSPQKATGINSSDITSLTMNDSTIQLHGNKNIPIVGIFAFHYPKLTGVTCYNNGVETPCF